jgi:hypothetical protein
MLALQRDSILLSFRDAKASLIEFDEATNSIKTTSLHCWEDSALTWGRTSFPFPPIAATDPQVCTFLMTSQLRAWAFELIMAWMVPMRWN